MLLERRPDIAEAERRVAAANAQIGVAISAFFPNLSLTGSDQYTSSTIGALFNISNRVWSFGPSLAETLFDAGARSAAVDQAREAYDQNVANYRQTVLAGFQQVEDELAALRILEQQGAIESDVVKSAQDEETLTLNQYKAGTVPYSSVITAQTTLLTSQQTALSVLENRLTASVTLIEALGGGWNSAQLPNADQLEDDTSFVRLIPVGARSSPSPIAEGH
jgi:NodT family efflux transporter outer membrane factor (OMF) lipoprotein